VRLYVNELTGDTVSVFLIAGLPAEISSHTPDICYPGAGYTLGKPKPFRLTEGASTATLNSADATKPSTTSSTERLSIIWGWDDGAGWRAPEDPRMEYMSRSALCKLYVVTSVKRPVDKLEETPTAELLRRLLPELHLGLFGDEKKARGPTPPRPGAPR
jgi:hypothetical protein